MKCEREEKNYQLSVIFKLISVTQNMMIYFVHAQGSQKTLLTACLMGGGGEMWKQLCGKQHLGLRRKKIWKEQNKLKVIKYFSINKRESNSMSVKESGMIINFLLDRIFSPILYWQLKNKVKLYSPEKTNNTWDEVAQDEYLP